MGVFVKPFREMSKKDSEAAGGKAANLSELTQAGFNVPPGFCVTSASLAHLLDQNGLWPKIDNIIASFNYEDFDAMDRHCAEIRRLIIEAQIPADLDSEIRANIAELTADDCFVAVRSSVAVKGMPISSFPGMMDTYHFLKGEDEIIEHIRKCWASLWTQRATYNRYHKQIDHHLGLIAPTVQRMVNPDTAGILFTANPITGSRDEMVIEGNWGLGESVVSGKSMNDFFLIDKATVTEKRRQIAKKTVMCVFDQSKGSGRIDLPVPPEKMELPTLSTEQVVELAKTGLEIEKLFGFPQDIEWSIENGVLYILQSRNIRNLPE